MKLATLCYVRKGGKTLMLHRIKKKNDMHAGKWNGLGGKMDPGESPEECVIREVREESGLRIWDPVLKGFLTFPGFDGEDDWYVFVYVAEKFRGRLLPPERVREGHLEWVPDDEVFHLKLWDGDRIFLKWLKRPGFFSGKFLYRKGRLVRHHVVFHG
jgi:8-oxo-dGTP diphosphatase